MIIDEPDALCVHVGVHIPILHGFRKIDFYLDKHVIVRVYNNSDIVHYSNTYKSSMFLALGPTCSCEQRINSANQT